MIYIFLKKSLKFLFIFYLFLFTLGNFSSFKDSQNLDFNPINIISNFFNPSKLENIEIKTNENKLLYVKHLSFSGNLINIDYDKFIFQILNNFNTSKNYLIKIKSCRNSNNLNAQSYNVDYNFKNLDILNNSIKNFKFNINSSLKSLIKYDFNICNFELILNNSILYSFNKKIYFKR